MASNNHPLVITEIIAIVFDHLQYIYGTSSLFACAQVNHLWAEEAIPRIWSQGNCWGHEINSLLRVPNYRRQSYANHMRSIDDLWFKDLKYYHSILLAPLKFPRLRSASFLIPNHRDEIFRLQYLVPSLRKLEIYEHGWDHDEYISSDYAAFDYVSDDFFLQIQKRCPNLEEFEIERPQNNAQAESILSVLRNTPSIRRISITSNRHCSRCDLKEGPAKDAYMYLFTLLAKHATLRELKWRMLMFRALVEEVTKTTPRPFRQLRNLECHATDTAMVALLPRLSNLEVLDLSMDIESPRSRYIMDLSILPSLAQCTNLRVFNLSACSYTGVHIPLQDILDFASACNQLEQLEINAGLLNYDIRIPGFSDSHFEVLVSQLPCLRKLEFRLGLKEALSTQSLFSLGAHCPYLEELDLGGVFDLSLLGSTDRVLFPSLRETILRNVESRSGSSADTCATMMYYHAPKSYLGVMHSDKFGAAVEDAHRSLREKPHVFLLNRALKNLGELKDRIDQHLTI